KNTLSQSNAEIGRIVNPILQRAVEVIKKSVFINKTPSEKPPVFQNESLLSGLNSEQQEQIVNYCLSLYSSSARAFEEAAVEFALTSPLAKEFSQEMSRRLYKL